MLPSSPVARVRAFNRFYTRRIGVLQEHLLDSHFSLTEVRVLYELAHHRRITAVDICRNLSLDPGYLSRILQRFQQRRMVDRRPSGQDARRALLSLTPAGRRTFDVLNRRSDQQVRAMLGELEPSARGRLLQAMAEVEKALAAEDAHPPAEGSRTAWSLRRHRPGDMGWVVHRHGALYWQEYRYDERFEALVAEIVSGFIQNLDLRRERCWIAEQDGRILGSVFLVRKSDSIAKLRLLLVEPSARGLGIGRRLVRECVTFARKSGYRKIVLWTQSELLAARHLYQEAGFRLSSHKRHDSWGRKGLVSEVWELEL